MTPASPLLRERIGFKFGIASSPAKQEIDVSILTCCSRFLERFRVFSKSICRQNYDLNRVEVLVANPLSPDDLSKFLAMLKSSTAVPLFREVPVEVTHFRNRGLMLQKVFEQARGKIVIGMDCDLILPPDFLERIVTIVAQNPQRVVGVYRNFLSHETTSSILTGALDPFSNLELLNKEDQEEEKGYRGILGYCQALTYDAWKQTGYPIEFDEIAKSDIAFNDRLAKIGVMPLFVRDVVVFHLNHERNWEPELLENVTKFAATPMKSTIALKAKLKHGRVACLLTAYRRPQNLAMQIAAVESQSIGPSEMAIWRNFYPDQPFEENLLNKYPNITSTNHNWGVWPRFLLCSEFESEYICVLDDDTIPGPHWLENCLTTIKESEGLLGAIGVTFLQGDRSQIIRAGWAQPIDRVIPVDIVGHAWFFKRDWLRYYALEPRHGCRTAGEDYHFSVAIQKHLGLETFVPPHNPTDKTAWGSTHGKLGTDEVALYKQNGEEKNKEDAHQAYLTNGWRTLYHRGKLKFGIHPSHIRVPDVRTPPRNLKSELPLFSSTVLQMISKTQFL